MQYILIRQHDNWADEMDIEGVLITDQDTWNQYLTKIQWPATVCIGTNEEIEYDNIKGFLRSITIKSITSEDLTVLTKLFGLRPVDNIGDSPYPRLGTIAFPYAEIEE